MIDSTQINFPQCTCGHGWDYHLYGEDQCVKKECKCEKFQNTES